MKKVNKKTIIILFLIIGIIAFLITVFCLKDTHYSNTTNNNYASGGSGRGSLDGERITYNFNYGWTFSKGSGKLNSGTTQTSTNPVTAIEYIPNPTSSSDERDLPYSSNYDPTHYTDGISNGVSTWKEVSLPHTYNDEDTFNNFMETGLTGERTMYSGTAWYKKTFNLDASYENTKQIIIEFEAARQAAKVWVNGHLLTGTYQNGFIAFGYKIPTEYLNYGEGVSNQNTITVEVDNSYPYKMEVDGASTNSVVSWHDSHWHPNYGGLYRNSYLYVVDNVHLTVPLYSFTEGTGTYIYTSIETPTAAFVHVDAEVENDSDTAKTFTYRAIIKNMAGQEVLRIDNNPEVTLNAFEKQVYQMTGTLENPIWWSTDYPYLYTCEVEILINNTVVDNNLNTFGVRTFRFTTDYGFYLNEYYNHLNGWGQKPTWEWAVLGAAYPDWLSDYSVKMLKDAGGNYIRFGHTAGSPTQINMCDKYGILVTQPGVDGEGAGGSGGVYDLNTYRLRVEAMRDNIIYFRNHPSIILWELGNQASGLATTADLNFVTRTDWLNYDLNDYTPKSIANILYDVINKYDYGNRQDLIVPSSGKYNDTSDSSNRLITIRRVSADVEDYIDVVEITDGTGSSDSKPLIEAEYNRLEARRGVWDTNTSGFTDFRNSSSDGTDYINGTSETFAVSQIKKKSSVLSATGNIGGANWIFSDTISHGRLQSEVARASGEVDAVMLPKEAYYVSQVINSSVPAIHIIGHWNYPTDTIKNIYVAASNVNSVELFVNGISVGFGTKSSTNLYTFNSVNYIAGNIEAKGYDDSNNVIVSDIITTHGAPDHLSITAFNSPSGLIANGSDILILDVKLLDSNNNLCSTYDGEVNNTFVNFTYSLNNSLGQTGEFLGGYNSGVPENTRSDSLYLEAGVARVFVRTTNNAGPISVTATMGDYADTFTTTSLVNTVTNGLSSAINVTSNYVLDDAKNSGLGTGSKLGVEESESFIVSKLYIENLSYSGSVHDGNGIYDSFSNNEYAYSDIGIRLTNVPYKFYNAEYIRLPNDDRGIVADDLVVFDVTRNVTIYIARDPSLSEPLWLTNEYTKSLDSITGEIDTITAANGVTYEIWKKDVIVNIINDEVVNTTITIGGNTDDGISGLLGTNQIIFVKPTSEVANRTFFKQDFNYFTPSNIIFGWSGYIPDDNTNIERANFLGHTALRFTDDNSANLAYTNKKFATINDGFTLSFKAYVGNNKVNSWLRTFLSDGIPRSVTEMRNIPIEAYLFRDGNSVTIKYKDVDAATQTAIPQNILDVNTWYTYKYYVDIINHNWTIEVYDELGTTLITALEHPLPFRQRYISFENNSLNVDITGLNFLTFATGKTASFTSDFYIDDVEIIPDMDIGITGMTINDTFINVNNSITSYILASSVIPSEAVISLNETEDYYNITRINDDINDKISFDLENLRGDHFLFDVNIIRNSALEGWYIEPDGSQPDPLVSATSEQKDNSVVIHIQDNSSTNNTYIYREINPISTAMSLSFDFYLNDSLNVGQELLKVFLASQIPLSSTDFEHIAMRSYFTPQDQTTNEYIMTTTKINGVDNNLLDDTLITKNTWHNIEYKVNVDSHSYSIYLDGNKIITTYDFYNNEDVLNYILIGTDTLGTADFYVRNVNYQEETGKPINGIYIDQVNIPGFDNESDTNYYYTDGLLTIDTNIELITNAFYLSTSSIIKDVANQQIIIEVYDNFNNLHTYTIIYDALINRPISPTDLQELITYAETFRASSSNYTYNTWNLVDTNIIEANRVLDNPSAIAIDYSKAYFDLEMSLNNLLLLWTYDGYSTATVETIKYSSNLKFGDTEVFSFNKVLDNNEIVYYDSSTNIFTSIPYKYLNAEYLLINKAYYKNALIVLQPLQSIDILVFKDRDAGPLTEPGFTYTNEIATSSEGVVYKIYKKSFTVNEDGIYDVVNLEFEKLVDNGVNSNNNIIAFINTSYADNNTFINEDFSIYDSNLFNRAWEVKKTAHADLTFDGSIGSSSNSVQLTSDTASTSTWGFSMMYRRMAKLKENIVFKYSFNMASLDDKINQYNRTWLRQGPGDITATTADTNNGDKANALIDLYVFNNTTRVNSTYKSNTSSPAEAYAGLLAVEKGNRRLYYSGDMVQANNWITVEAHMNLLTRKFYLRYGMANDFENTAVTYPTVSMNNTSNSTDLGSNRSVTYADYIYFASRLQGNTDIRYKDIIVYPVDSYFYNDLNVSNNSISNYHDLTKTYLYKVADLNAYNNTVLTAVQGSLFTDDGAVSNPSISTATVLNNKYSTISENYESVDKGTYSRDYQVYYEVDSDNATILNTYGKSDLVDLLNQAQNIESTYYTSDSYALLAPQIERSINCLSDHSVEITSDTNENDVTDVYLGLQNAINNLVPLNNTIFSYQGKIIANKVYSDFSNQEVNITNKSSFTANYSLESRITGDYLYANMPHVFYLKTDNTLYPGTKITMIDRADNTAQVYYYIVSQEDYNISKVEYLLSDFILTGTTDQHFLNEYHLNNSIISGDYTFIFDFKDTIDLPTDSHTLSFEMKVNNNKISSSPNLTYSLYNNTSTMDVDLSAGNDNYSKYDTVDMSVSGVLSNIIVDGINVIDTTLSDKLIGARFSIYDASNNLISFPKGATLDVNGLVYHLSSDGYLRSGSGDGITSFNKQFSIDPGFSGFTPGLYYLKLDIVATYDRFNDASIANEFLLGSHTIGLTISDEASCSIYATIGQNTNVILKNIATNLIVNVKSSCNNVSDDQIITLSLAKKTLPLHSDFDYTLVDYQQYVNDSITTIYDANVYKISTHEYVDLERVNYEDNYQIRFNSLLPTGMYRLEFDIRTGNIKTSDFITFIVK